MEKFKLPHDHGHHIDKLIECMSYTNNFEIIADIFKLLGDSSRIQIFWILCHCEECVINLSALVNMTSPAVSHHLKQLKARGLIVSRREGKEYIIKQQIRNRHSFCTMSLKSLWKWHALL